MAMPEEQTWDDLEMVEEIKRDEEEVGEGG